jgi:hypothetical protein
MWHTSYKEKIRQTKKQGYKIGGLHLVSCCILGKDWLCKLFENAPSTVQLIRVEEMH